ncbi:MULTISPECIES: sigma-70 family RNA polymerase sigma factor [Aphanothece]|uniref:sigma-70 family RNA polymerase sigma factor n=1 Tax=Aphanothece TaxID=1121 RepID=UPI00398489FA
MRSHPRDPSATLDPLQRDPQAANAIQIRNRALLRQLGRCRRPGARLQWRNALVENNMALVRMVAQRESRRTGQPFDELCSAGYEGLVRAVEGFDTGRAVSLSTYVVPCVRGAMLQDRRDRQQPIQTPRRLRELHRRAERWMEERRAAGLPPAGNAAMAAALQCSVGQLEEAGRVQRALQLRSLDGPPEGGEADGAAGCWLDQLADPAACPGSGACPEVDPELSWLEDQLARLPLADRRLLEGRWMEGLSWRDLAAELRQPPQRCRRRGDQLLARLQRQASTLQSSRARSAARVV